MSDVVITQSVKNTEDCAQIQELTDVKQLFNLQRTKYVKYKILYDILQECVTNTNTLDDELKMKIQNILLSCSCAQVVPLENEDLINQDSRNLLGISRFNNTELSYSESAKLKKILATTLREKYNSICEEFLKITHQNIHEISSLQSRHDFLDLNLTTDDFVLLEYKRKLNEQQKQYFQNLLTEQEALDDLTKLRLECLPKMCNEKVKEYQVKSQMNVLRTKIVQEKTRVDIFMETEKSFRAYEKAIKNIKEQQEQCKKDIEYLKSLKEKYNHVACKQFSDLLKSYIQYKTSLEKKKLIYESLKS